MDLTIDLHAVEANAKKEPEEDEMSMPDMVAGYTQKEIDVLVALLEEKTALELRCKAGGSLEGHADVETEWREVQTRLELLITENSMLEAASLQLKRTTLKLPHAVTIDVFIILPPLNH